MVYQRQSHEKKAKVCIKKASIDLIDLMKHSKIQIEVGWRSVDDALRRINIVGK